MNYNYYIYPDKEMSEKFNEELKNSVNGWLYNLNNILMKSIEINAYPTDFLRKYIELNDENTRYYYTKTINGIRIQDYFYLHAKFVTRNTNPNRLKCGFIITAYLMENTNGTLDPTDFAVQCIKLLMLMNLTDLLNRKEPYTLFNVIQDIQYAFEHHSIDEIKLYEHYKVKRNRVSKKKRKINSKDDLPFTCNIVNDLLNKEKKAFWSKDELYEYFVKDVKAFINEYPDSYTKIPSEKTMYRLICKLFNCNVSDLNLNRMRSNQYIS